MYKSTFQIKSFATFYKYAVTPYVRTTEFILTSVKCMRISLSLEKKKKSILPFTKENLSTEKALTGFDFYRRKSFPWKTYFFKNQGTLL